jgi:hypothetical protein
VSEKKKPDPQHDVPEYDPSTDPYVTGKTSFNS